MKKCTNCNQVFSDENDFCTNDGTTLVADPGKTGFGGFPTSGEMPTQYVARPTEYVSQGAPSSNIQYLVIGVLATALVCVGLYLFLSRDPGKQTSDPNANLSQTNSAVNTPLPVTSGVAVPRAENRNATSTPSLPTVDPYISPAGTWQGQWTNGKGSAFSQQLTLKDEGNGRVSGQIIHTLQQTINPQKMGKIGLTAVEYVQGSYDPNTRLIMLSGIRKNDPNDLIILDKYRLSISSNNSVVAGSTFGGRTRGQVTFRR